MKRREGDRFVEGNVVCDYDIPVFFFFFFLDTSRDDVFFFFFQAEDGIRDLYVTGVQTCALPISCSSPRWKAQRSSSVSISGVVGWRAGLGWRGWAAALRRGSGGTGRKSSSPGRP